MHEILRRYFKKGDALFVGAKVGIEVIECMIYKKITSTFTCQNRVLQHQLSNAIHYHWT